MDDCSERDPVVSRHFFCQLRPGLFRPSTHSPLSCRQKDVAAGDKRIAAQR
jgi:hypothetical protein